MLGALLFSLLSGSSSGLGQADLDSLASAVRTPQPLARAMNTRIQHLTEDHDTALAEESLALVVPLADRLGLQTERALLEDASFQTLNPDAYTSLRAQLPSPEEDQFALTQVTRTLHSLLADAPDAVITSRVKSIYGLHAKMQRKGLPLDAIADRLAVRARVGDEASCYALLDALHQEFEPVEGELDDYIQQPKASGYQSLHTAVKVEGQPFPVEIQIRTHAMHDAAENGPAAHWRYKIAAA